LTFVLPTGFLFDVLSLHVIASVIMENGDKAELEGFLKVLPPVDFCCVYGSALHPNNREKVSFFFFFFVLFALLILLFSS
jgi:hypothetical protein